MKKILGFLRAYVKSMRLYYSFVTGIAGWLGVSYYEYLAGSAGERTIEILPSVEKKILILVLLFLSWGINQIINDYLGRKEDRINAPDRPMVNGELHPEGAVILSLVLLAAAGVLTWFFLQPVAILFMVAGVLLNVLYQFCKRFGLLGNVVFGLMITMATLFGGFGSGPTRASLWAPHRLSALLLLWLINALMTFYTYFKDYRGDRETGTRTIVVSAGLRVSRYLAVFASVLPTILFLVLRWTGLLAVRLNTTFILLGILTVFLQIWTGVLFFRNPVGTKSYLHLKTNFRACACGEATLIGLFNPDLAVWLFILSYILVDFLFDFHKNPRA